MVYLICFSSYPFIHFLHCLVFQATSHWFWHFVSFSNWLICLKVLSTLMGFFFDELLNHFRKKNALNLRRREEKKMTKLNLHVQKLKKKIWMFTAEKRQTCEFFFSPYDLNFLWTILVIYTSTCLCDIACVAYYLYSNTSWGLDQSYFALQNPVHSLAASEWLSSYKIFLEAFLFLVSWCKVAWGLFWIWLSEAVLELLELCWCQFVMEYEEGCR